MVGSPVQISSHLIVGSDGVGAVDGVTVEDEGESLG